MPKPIISYTVAITSDQVEILRRVLTDLNFEFSEKPYAHFSAKRDKLNVTAYEKGPKVLVQGKETETFVKDTLEPLVLGESTLGRDEELHPDRFTPHIGVDESGKGDFFGPLVVAGVFTTRESVRFLIEEGVMDSKRITSDSRIRKLSSLIRDAPEIEYEVLTIEPPRYNELYESFGSVNRMLAWGHATVIEQLLIRCPDCPRALCDQFAAEDEILNALQSNGRLIQVEQRTKAESDIAVAAASILARETFIDWVDAKSELYDFEIPRGASNNVKVVGGNLVRLSGMEELGQIAKVHFQTYQDILDLTHLKNP